MKQQTRLAASALARASKDVRRLSEALEAALESVSNEEDPATACLALDQLREARRNVERTLREAQEVADVAVDALIDDEALGADRAVTGVVPIVKLTADV